MKKINLKQVSLALLISIFSFSAQAQDNHHGHHGHEGHQKEEKKPEPQPAPQPVAQDTTHQHHHEHGEEMPAMTHSFSLNLPMNRNASGTSWLPDETPIYAYMKHGKKWNYMLHGNLFLRYNSQDIAGKGSRGARQFDAPNWVMGMAQRRVGQRGLVAFKAMLSLDRLTVGGGGYPLLFQSGETWKGEPLVDRQHPHDLFAELAASYSYAFTEDIDAFVYIGYPGEPALGAPAFMHRISAINNPDAPLGHHWQDATHITFGVATAGFRYKMFKVEASSFTGREPDENRYDFDKPRFDSYSYRLSVNPSRSLALQFSQGFIKTPEALEPDTDVKRTSASIIHSGILGKNKYIATSAVWGMNNKGHGHKSNAFLLESNLQLGKTAIYGRYELTQKDQHELNLRGFEHDDLYNINALTLGVSYQLLSRWSTNLVVGVQGTVFEADQKLDMLYGNNPMSGQVYVRVTPGWLRM